MKRPQINTRVRPNVVLRSNVVNQSARTAGVRLNLVVLHSTESHNRPGTSDLAGVMSWFDNPSAQASSHVIVDADGNSARCVPDERKAWHCQDYNSASLGIEQIGYAAQGRNAWRRNWRELRETARWIARWSRQHRIPIRRAHVANGVVTRSGVTTHAKLGAAGGGHWDPGDYPLRRVLLLARLYKLALTHER